MSHRAFDPSQMAIPDAYKLLNVCVSPRPIAFVSTLSPEGKPNLAPFSYFMAGGANPPSVTVSPLNNRHGQPKDTLVNIEATGEYTISIVTYGIREKMNQASFEYPYGVSEWDEAGFTKGATELVKPARVLESPLAMECKLFQIVKHGPGPLSANYIIGEVVRYWIDEALLDETGKVDATRVDYIARMSGDWYTRAQPEAMFELARPMP
jgi:flavin reductase (DIM6/NTAB) family NADH-FMN oxidoreductase RutF